jgi:pescadillo protein
MGKISQMGKKGKKGVAANYLTRNQAVKKLQISLKDFRCAPHASLTFLWHFCRPRPPRFSFLFCVPLFILFLALRSRLCILKGVFPRDPKRKHAGKNKTYYHRKDIAFLQYEPLLHKFRELKTFLKKHKKAMSRQEFAKAADLNKHRPQLTLDHLIKERYPSFIDAVRDIDDALCMVHLYAMLPAGTTKVCAAAPPSHPLSCAVSSERIFVMCMCCVCVRPACVELMSKSMMATAPWAQIKL